MKFPTGCRGGGRAPFAHAVVDGLQDALPEGSDGRELRRMHEGQPLGHGQSCSTSTAYRATSLVKRWAAKNRACRAPKVWWKMLDPVASAMPARSSADEWLPAPRFHRLPLLRNHPPCHALPCALRRASSDPCRVLAPASSGDFPEPLEPNPCRRARRPAPTPGPFRRRRSRTSGGPSPGRCRVG